jgi:hypothetical protein
VRERTVESGLVTGEDAGVVFSGGHDESCRWVWIVGV